MSAWGRALGAPAAPCGRRFDEALLSGFVDGVLTQQQRQQVQLHLESCTSCAAEVSELVALRDAARGTRFVVPADEQWDERPKSGTSRVLRLSGWVLVVAWLALVTGYATVELLAAGIPTWQRLLVVGGVLGFALLLLSVLLDRLREMQHDRYRRVQK